MIIHRPDVPKMPRWITSEAGQWAWREQVAWRRNAFNAVSVQERHRLLVEAERMYAATAHDAAA